MTDFSDYELLRLMLVKVARRLKALLPDVVFVGGAITPFLVSEKLAEKSRATDDVDLVIEVAGYPGYSRLEDRLRTEFSLVHSKDKGAPICRWLAGDVQIDIMPADGSILGFTNTWYHEALRAPLVIAIADELTIQVIRAPCFIATKLEAFGDRGKHDYVGSQDMEDINSVINGRAELASELLVCTGALRHYVIDQFTILQNNSDFQDAIGAHLNPDNASQSRGAVILDRMRTITEPT